MVRQNSLWCRYVLRKSCIFEACCYAHLEDWMAGDAPTTQPLKMKDKRVVLNKVKEALERAVASGVELVSSEEVYLQMLSTKLDLVGIQGALDLRALQELLNPVYPFLKEVLTTRPSPGVTAQSKRVKKVKTKNKASEPLIWPLDVASVSSLDNESLNSMASPSSLCTDSEALQCEKNCLLSPEATAADSSEECPTLEFLSSYYL